MNAADISLYPVTPIQGDPLMIVVENASTTSVAKIIFADKPLKTFSYKGKSTALYGIDIRARVGTTSGSIILTNGEVIPFKIYIGERTKYTAPLDIPQSLGGNTATSAQAVVSTLAIENASFLGLRTGTHAFWTQPFRYPVANPIVTDTYGYSRDTVGYTITHKGADFRAESGTPVYAMNRGVVRMAQTGRNYGKTIIVDHGLGLQTFYLHLSRIDVNVGELVLPGQQIGLSGQTGYALGPHLHTTVRIGEVSIDPVKFMGLFK